MDPQLHPPTGCTVVATGVNTSPDSQLNCTGASFGGVIQHYNFGPVNSHDCTGLNIGNAGVVSTLLIDDIYYLDTGSCAISTGNDNFWLFVGARFPGGITLSNSTIDFNNSVVDTQNGPICVSLARCNGWFITFSSDNNVVSKYNAILHSPTDLMASQRNTATDINSSIWQYNFISAWQSRGPNGHKEMYAAQNAAAPITSAGNTIGGFTFDHNVVVNDANATTNFGPTFLYMANGTGLTYGSGPNITNNTVMQAHVGGRPVPGGTTFTACIGATYSSGCVLGATNNIMFVTSENHTLGYGAGFTCGSVGIVTYKTLPGPYPTGVVEELGLDGISGGQYYPTWNATSTPQSCSGTVAAEEISDAALMTGHGQSYASPVMTGNYVDIDSYANGGASPNAWDFFSTDTTPNPIAIASGSISGNTLTTSVNMTMEMGLYIYAANIPGCSPTAKQGCPRLLTGGSATTTFSLDTTFGSPVAAEPMSAYNLIWCGTPAVLSGNHSLSGASGSVPDSWLNQLSTKQANSGC
jgi:hypothetical protein